MLILHELQITLRYEELIGVSHDCLLTNQITKIKHLGQYEKGHVIIYTYTLSF